jgi:hypothetical protein
MPLEVERHKVNGLEGLGIWEERQREWNLLASNLFGLTGGGSTQA